MHLTNFIRWLSGVFHRKTKCKLVLVRKVFSFGKIPACIVIIKGKFKDKIWRVVVFHLMHLCSISSIYGVERKFSNQIHLFNPVFFKLFQWDIKVFRCAVCPGFEIMISFLGCLCLVCSGWCLLAIVNDCDSKTNQLNVLLVLVLCVYVCDSLFRFRSAFGDETFIGKSSRTSRTYHI